MAPTLREQKVPPSGVSPCLAGVIVHKVLGAYARLLPDPTGPCRLSLSYSLSPRGDQRPVMLFQIKVLSPVWSLCGLAAVAEGRLDCTQIINEWINTCVQLQGNFVSEAEEPKKASRQGKVALRSGLSG